MDPILIAVIAFAAAIALVALGYFLRGSDPLGVHRTPDPIRKHVSALEKRLRDEQRAAAAAFRKSQEDALAAKLNPAAPEQAVAWPAQPPAPAPAPTK